jgi:hypothetical protein
MPLIKLRIKTVAYLHLTGLVAGFFNPTTSGFLGACSGVSDRLTICPFSLGMEDSSQLAAGFFNWLSDYWKYTRPTALSSSQTALGKQQTFIFNNYTFSKRTGRAP